MGYAEIKDSAAAWLSMLVLWLFAPSNRLDAFKAPVEIFARDSERWGKPDHGIVRLLAENTEFLECFAEGARGRVQLDGDPEAAAAHRGDVRAIDLLQAVERIFSEIGGLF